MSQFKTFKFTADTVNGQILEFPKVFNLRCDKVTPIGQDIVRQFDGNECINAIRVYLIVSDGQLLGSRQFKGLDDFITYRNANCKSICTLPYLTINKCFMDINGCQARIYSCQGYNFSIFGCAMTVNGCSVVLN